MIVGGLFFFALFFDFWPMSPFFHFTAKDASPLLQMPTFHEWGWSFLFLGTQPVKSGLYHLLRILLPNSISHSGTYSFRVNYKNDIDRITFSSQEPEKLFKNIFRKIRSTVSCENCEILSLNYQTKSLYSWHLGSITTQIECNLKESYIEWLNSEVYESLSSRNIGNTGEVEEKWIASRTNSGIRSMLFVPITLNGNCLAHLFLSSKELNAFSDDDEHFLSSLSDYLGATIRNEALKRVAKHQAALANFLADIDIKFDELDAQELLDDDEQTKKALQAFTDTSGSFLEGDLAIHLRKNEELIVAGATAGAMKLLPQKGFSSDGPILKKMAEAGDSSFHESSEGDDYRLLTVPLKLAGHLFGTLTLIRKFGHDFDRNDERMVSGLADQTVDLIQKQRRHKEEREQLKFLQRILQINSDALFITNVDQKVILWNPGAENLYGYKKSEAIGKGIHDLIFHDDQNEDPEFSDELTSSPYGKKQSLIHAKAITRNKDGNRITVQLTRLPVLDKNKQLVAFCGIAKELHDDVPLKAKT